MDALTASEARKNLFPLIKQVNEDFEAVEIVSKHGNAVLMSKEEYDSIVETAYLLNSKDAPRLLESRQQAREGKVFARALLG